MSLLDSVRLAFECPLRWEKLVGGDQRRYCAQCQKHVHNLSGMSRQEAEELLASAETPICVRVEVDAQGRTIHRPALAGALLAAGVVAAGVVAQPDCPLPATGLSSPGAAMGQAPTAVIPEVVEPGAIPKQSKSDNIPELHNPPAPVEPPRVLMGDIPSRDVMGGISPLPSREVMGR